MDEGRDLEPQLGQQGETVIGDLVIRLVVSGSKGTSGQGSFKSVSPKEKK